MGMLLGKRRTRLLAVGRDARALIVIEDGIALYSARGQYRSPVFLLQSSHLGRRSASSFSRALYRCIGRSHNPLVPLLPRPRQQALVRVRLKHYSRLAGLTKRYRGKQPA